MRLSSLKTLPLWAKLGLAGSVLLFSLGALVAVGLAASYWYYGAQLPPVSDIQDHHFNVPMRIYTRDGDLIAEFGQERRATLEFEEIPPVLWQAFLAAEDARFFEHPGVDWQGLVRAAINLTATGERTQGGSTITMQLARNLYLSRERSYVRKFKEIVLALRIERELTKQQILELYLNKIYLGQRAYGVGAAAQVYYGTGVKDLTLAQAAMIAGLPKAPSRDNPISNPEQAMHRRNYVLRRMLELDYISQAEHDEAMATALSAREHAFSSRFEADYLAELVRSELVRRYGEAAYTEGYKVTTTITGERQVAANRALRRALLAYDQRHGYRGAEARVDAEVLEDETRMRKALDARQSAGGLVPAIVLQASGTQIQAQTEAYGRVTLERAAFAWATSPKKPQPVSRGDVIRLAYTGNEKEPWQLSQVPEVQGALVALNPEDGAVEAMVGGFDFQRSKFNRATQAYRQPGSAFKPYLYSAALAKGFTPASIILDAPVVYDDPGLDKAWRPKNYSGRVHGPTRLRVGLRNSFNLVSIRLLEAIGVGYTRDYATKFGLPKDRLPPNLSMALGTATITPLQMARGFAVFANGGYLVEPYFISEIRDARDEIVYQAEPVRACEDCAKEVAPAPQTISKVNAWLMNDLLRDVVRNGTGRRAMRLGRNDLAGKTGTTNDQKDAWFAGFNPELVAVSWVGFDQLQPLGSGETGSRAALPMWIDFMGAALKDKPEKYLARPQGLVTVRIDPESGKLARSGNPDAIFETLQAGHEPELESSYDRLPDYQDPYSEYSGAPDYRGGGRDDSQTLF